MTWILLGQSNEETLSPNVWKQFMVSIELLTFYTVCIRPVIAGEYASQKTRAGGLTEAKYENYLPACHLWRGTGTR